ncbi:putative thiamine transport system substrate-binding protein [Tistlia consotensis]|uniref:Putative thiamine transport system substrate-binding protein n=1 Tax=Tistlia consotensis USBA 355 TaxID=560819 RepID=A0A1Y6BLF0_9PROT|nr:ABC transporter substrate-binding protein [Tistlia consotensis]SMF07032.1 putative thiamine transport system substrate-binding protein [Tistlia consotensis USBA 355]SNR36130.1 putative thiamine transport system substrate-binding protein [Tistlia consotensis]
MIETLRWFAVAFGLVLALGGPVAPARAAEPLTWDQALQQARGETVYWNAWAGDERINAYIAWVGERVKALYGITVEQVKLTDTAEAVSRVLAEKAAGKTEDGSVDLVWINGENFATMKENGLLYGPFVRELPNFALVDTRDKPTTLVDFTVPTEGLEAPWGMAKINFIYDSARVHDTPGSIPAFADWAEAHPGRFTYPAPPDFIGSTFLKQVLIELTADADQLQKPVASDSQFARVTAPLWAYLDRLHPSLWRGGRVFPASGPAELQLLDDGELDVAISFYPSEAQSLIDNGRLPKTARVFVLDDGTIGNTHFVAIPFNARAKAAAMVVADFLMSPEAQARKQDPQYWGDDTVLAMDRLTPQQRALFTAIKSGPASLPPDRLGPVLLEPHPTWMTRIEAEWARRYGG